jgi:formate-dependent nitrite reductase membrane component NrfD
MEDASLFGRLMADYGIGLSYILLGLAVVGAILSSVLGIARNPGGLKQAGIGIGVFAVVFGIAYFMSSDSVPQTSLSPEVMETITPSVSKWVGTGLYAFYILFLAAIAAAVYSEVSKLFK